MEPSSKRRRLNFYKCTFCRRDKKPCIPLDRVWPGQRCNRCQEKGFECSSNQKTNGLEQQQGKRLAPGPRSNQASHALRLPQAYPDWMALSELSIRASWISRLLHNLAVLRDLEREINRRVDGRKGNVNFTDWLYIEILSECRWVGAKAHAFLTSGSPTMSWSAMSILEKLDASWSIRPVQGFDTLHETWPGAHMGVSSMFQTALDKVPTQASDPKICEFRLTAWERSVGDQISDPALASEKYQEVFQEYATCLNGIYGRGVLAPGSSTLPLTFHESLIPRLFPSCEQNRLCDYLGRTSLHVALYQGIDEDIVFDEITMDLAQHKDKLGLTPLHLACIKGNIEVVENLLHHEVPPVVVNDEGLSPLHYASAFGHDALARLLLDSHKLDSETSLGTLDSIDNYGNTPLLLAVENQHFLVVQELLRTNGVQLSLTNHRGETPLQVATRVEHAGIIKLLATRSEISRPVEKTDCFTPSG